MAAPDDALHRRLTVIWIKIGALSGLASGATIGVSVGLAGFALTGDAVWIVAGLLSGPSVGALLGSVASGISGWFATRHYQPTESPTELATHGKRSVWIGAAVIALVVGLWFREPLLGIGTFVVAVLVGRAVVPMIVERY